MVPQPSSTINLVAKLKQPNIEETTEFTVRVSASERLGMDLSEPEWKHLVRTVIESYLLAVEEGEKKDTKAPESNVLQGSREIEIKENLNVVEYSRGMVELKKIRKIQTALVASGISRSVIDDGLISKEEFQLTIFKNRKDENLFANRIFDLFNVKRKGAIDFGDFIRALSVFHPNAQQQVKLDCELKIENSIQCGLSLIA